MSPTSDASVNDQSNEATQKVFLVENFLKWFFLFIACAAAFSFYSYVVSENYEIDYGDGEVFEPGFEPE